MNTCTDRVWGMTPDVPLARQLAYRDIPSLVHDAVNLEGVAMTLPEVQTILDGITVGGHRISDQNMALNQARAWRLTFSLVDQQRFAFNKPTALAIHSVAAHEEALAWGTFRTGHVTIAGTAHAPPAPDVLDACWQAVEQEVAAQTDAYDRATTAFLQMARAQFFWDVNKRTGRFMMNGILLACGFPIINVPARRQLEFNRLMLSFYDSGEMGPMQGFLRSCLDPRIIRNFAPATPDGVPTAP